MIPPLYMWIFSIALIAITVFFVWSLRNRKRRSLLRTLYLWLAIAYTSWVIPILLMGFADQADLEYMFVLDCLTQPGGSSSAPLYLCIAISFVKGYEKLPRWMKLLFILPCLTVLIACTNPLHGLMYKEFSVIRSEIQFGPYLMISGMFNYACLIGTIIYLVRFSLKNKTNLYSNCW